MFEKKVPSGASGAQKPLGLYLHIPFCRSKCAYCDFYSKECDEKNVKYIKRYTDALLLHMEDSSKSASDYCVDTVYIGGGTPTILPVNRLLDIIDGVKYSFNVDRHAEITIEANPATIKASNLTKLRKNGVNRISIGLQSAFDDELAELKRIHTYNDFLDSFADVKAAGFENVNVDVMYGIPKQTVSTLRMTLEYVTSLAPEHISLYGLKIEDGTPLAAKRYSLDLPDEDTEYEMYMSSIEFLASKGYEQYEISNFARDRKYCRHNLKYWNCDEYLGLGPAAHSYFGGERFAYKKNTDDYITAMETPDAGVSLISEKYEISPSESLKEYVMLRLRLNDGIDAREFFRRFGADFESMYGNYLGKYIDGGFMVKNGMRYAFTPKGMFVSNYILSEMLNFRSEGAEEPEAVKA